MWAPSAARRALMLLALLGLPWVLPAGVSARSACPAAEDWQRGVEAILRAARDAERLSLALTAQPSCSKVASRAGFVCSWRVQERVFEDGVLVGSASAHAVCLVDSRGRIGAPPASGDESDGPTCTIRFDFVPDAAGPCASDVE